MNPYFKGSLKYALILLAITINTSISSDSNQAFAVRHYLYVATPGVRNYLQYGGHGLLVFDMAKGFRFVKRIPIGGLDEKGQPSNVKGIAVSLFTHCCQSYLVL